MEILSIYFDTLGLAAAEENLSYNFPIKYPDCNYTAIKLSTIKSKIGIKGKFIGLVGYPLFTKLKKDLFFNRFRAEVSFSLLVSTYLKKIDKKNIDVLHFRTQSIALLLASTFRKYNSVITIDMTATQGMMLKPQSKFSYKPIIWLENKIFNSGAIIIGFSNTTRLAVIDGYNVNPEKAKFIYPSVNDSFFQIGERSISKKPSILFVGNDFIRKGGDLLLKVFKDNFVGLSELHFVSNDVILNDVALPEGVFVHRNVKPNSPELISLFSQADVFALPTREEAYGLVFSEAMAAGLPCIGTIHMAIPELVEDGKDGFLMEIDDEPALVKHLKTLLFNKELRQTMSQNAKEKAKTRYLRDEFLESYHKIFTSFTK